jgi:hypothetical protein
MAEKAPIPEDRWFVETTHVRQNGGELIGTAFDQNNARMVASAHNERIARLEQENAQAQSEARLYLTALAETCSPERIKAITDVALAARKVTPSTRVDPDRQALVEALKLYEATAANEMKYSPEFQRCSEVAQKALRGA